MIRKGGGPVLEPVSLTRVVSTAQALDGASYRPDAVVLRTAPDEALVIGDDRPRVDDPHAIIVEDGGWSGTWMTLDEADRLLRRNCSWELPPARPALAQGRVANAAVKLWVEAERVLLLVPHVSARDLAERMVR